MTRMSGTVPPPPEPQDDEDLRVNTDLSFSDLLRKVLRAEREDGSPDTSEESPG